MLLPLPLVLDQTSWRAVKTATWWWWICVLPSAWHQSRC